MNLDYDKVLKFAKQRIEDDDVSSATEDYILKIVEKSEAFTDIVLNEDEKNKACQEIKRICAISMGRMSIIRKKREPWLHLRNESQKKDFYTNRYKDYLSRNPNLSKLVINSIFETSDAVLECLANPLSSENFRKKGLVIGHVQSGKTANYIGLINRAADVGYKLIILIAGVHNNLRGQTQQRVNEGFIGYDSLKQETIGVGRSIRDTKNPVSFTNTINDFKKAQQLSMNFDPVNSNVPVILVIKKNYSTLNNIIGWLKADDKRDEYTNNYPVLIIDDEADNASVNTKKNPDETTRINQQIREIMRLFNKVSYVGYTATPFANIFIDPHSEDEMLGDDLFPDDFIMSLDAPSNYVGAQEIFAKQPDKYLRMIDDYEDVFPIPIPKECSIDDLPKSLYQAVQSFIISIALKSYRKMGPVHSSMLVNITHRTLIQEQIKYLLESYLQDLLRAIRFDAYHPLETMLNNTKMSDLYSIWEKEFNSEGEFQELMQIIVEKAELIKVAMINSKSKDDLSYDDYKDDGGLHVIAVGGYSLSRGFTLEGLTTSYFLRNSKMYDTLLQMGRWFGYRDGYSDLCRLYLIDDAACWYSHIADVIEELRDEVKKMEYYNLTPREYGLKVRSHPEGLLVTAKNKMYSGTEFVETRSFSEQLLETKFLSTKSDDISSNIETLRNLIGELKTSHRENEDTLWQNVPSEIIEEFIFKFANHPNSIETDSQNLLSYIQAGNQQELKNWDVFFASADGSGDALPNFKDGINVQKQIRTLKSQNIDPNFISFSDGGGRIVRFFEEERGLSEQEFENAEEDRKAAGVKQSSMFYRAHRARPLLVVKILQIKSKESGAIGGLESVVAYGISFPKSPVQRSALYVGNTIHMQRQMQNSYEEDDENDEFED